MHAVGPSTDATLAQAQRLSEPGAAPPAPAGTGARALAWALKDICYQSWSTEPPRAARAAHALRGLLDAGVPDDQSAEIEALAHWTEGIAQVTRGQIQGAVASLDRAASAFRKAGLPDHAAQTQVPKIMALSMLGQPGQAIACAIAAQRELLAHGNVRAASRVSLNLGNLQLRQNAYAEAARHYEEAAVLFARVGDHEQSVLADIGLAGALTSRGDFEAGLLMYRRARMRATNHGLEMPLALVDESVALVDLARGSYRDALAGLESARRRYEALGVPHTLAIAEKQLADAYLELRLLPEAQALLDAAVQKFEALEMPVELAWAIAQRGRCQALLGQRGAAAQSFARAVELFEGVGNGVGAAAIVLARAELALADGDAQSALAWSRRAMTGFAGAGDAGRLASAEVAYAQALLETGRRDEAEEAFAAALESARDLQQTQVQVRCLTGQGLVAQARGDTTAAAAAFGAAIDLFEGLRRVLPGEDLRSAFLADHLRPYQGLLRLAVQRGDAEDALRQLDRCRARTLGERIDEAPHVALDAGERELRDRLNWLYRRAQRLEEEAASSAALAGEMVRTERELMERARRRRLTEGERARDDALLRPADLCAALGDGDTLVEYGVLDDELFACVVTRKGVKLRRRIARWSQVVEAIRAARFQFDTLRHGATHLARHMDALAQRAEARLADLHALVWAPLARALGKTRRVIVVPHAQLGAVPFAALSDGTHTVGDRVELAVAPSARHALRGLRRGPAAPRRAVALGDAMRLRHAADEARLVGELLPGSRVLIGEAASLSALRQHAREADVVHLACHARFRSDNPRFSALDLHDGAVTVDVAESLDLGPCTVVLSACESGVAELGTGDEMVGLVRAFLVAGAARVVASLWPVDDAVTALFMQHFYRALREQKCPAAALRTAQSDLRKRMPHPYYWCAFTLYGGW